MADSSSNDVQIGGLTLFDKYQPDDVVLVSRLATTDPTKYITGRFTASVWVQDIKNAADAANRNALANLSLELSSALSTIVQNAKNDISSFIDEYIGDLIRKYSNLDNVTTASIQELSAKMEKVLPRTFDTSTNPGWNYSDSQLLKTAFNPLVSNVQTSSVDDQAIQQEVDSTISA